MATKTKYNVGDKVWHGGAGYSIKSTVRNIKIYKGVPTYYCDFFLSVIAFKEGELFPTKEELLNCRVLADS